MTEIEKKYWKVTARRNIDEMKYAVEGITESVKMMEKLVRAVEEKKGRRKI